jgi:4-diphosphocytidyl-2-C-methyl-D-erythritol kinase
MSHGRSIEARAFAKVNLCLAVGPPEPVGTAKAGFHPIVSWFHGVSLWDDVRVSDLGLGHAAQLDVGWAPDAPRTSPIDWPADKDLCMKSLRLLEEASGRPLPAKIRLAKRIPVGGGLGGGSSDAAATLLALDSLYSLSLGAERLRQLSAKLGSDVGFFLDDALAQQRHGQDTGTRNGTSSHSGSHAGAADSDPMRRTTPPRPALVWGFADRIERVAPCRAELVLVVPPFGCATGAVYKAFDGLERVPWSMEEQLSQARFVHAKAVAGDLDGSKLYNHLTRAAVAVEPRMGPLLRATADAARRPACMSGSGSCVFVACAPGQAEAIAERVRRTISADAGEGRRCMAMVVKLV